MAKAVRSRILSGKALRIQTRVRAKVNLGSKTACWTKTALVRVTCLASQSLRMLLKMKEMTHKSRRRCRAARLSAQGPISQQCSQLEPNKPPAKSSRRKAVKAFHPMSLIKGGALVAMRRTGNLSLLRQGLRLARWRQSL